MKRAGVVLSFLFLVFIVLLVFWISSQNFSKSLQLPKIDYSQNRVNESSSAATNKAEVNAQKITVIDGDTIDVDGVRVRYIGMNTPELLHGRGPDDCFAKEAADFNRSLVEKGNLRLEKDVSETDKYSRLLRYVYLPDGRMVNEILVEQGYARVATYPPDVAHASKFKELERQARLAKRGLWSKCR